MLREPNPFPGHPIQMRRLGPPVTVATRVAKPEIIRQHEDDVGVTGWSQVNL